jgi:hypothetical protein
VHLPITPLRPLHRSYIHRIRVPPPRNPSSTIPPRTIHLTTGSLHTQATWQTRIVPCQPAGTPPPQAVSATSAGDWSWPRDWVYYDGHDGVDYGISYRPVYAAADADQIVYAGWWDPQNHKINLGIYVRASSQRLQHLLWTYGSVAVRVLSHRMCLCAMVIPWYHGTTGNSSGCIAFAGAIQCRSIRMDGE